MRFLRPFALALLCLPAVGLFASDSDSPEDQAHALYQEAERTYLKGDAPGSLQILSKFFSSPGANEFHEAKIRAHNLRGLIFFQSKNLQQSVQEFESSVQLANRFLESTDSLLHLTRYNLGNALFQINRQQEAYEQLLSVNPEALDQDTRMRFHHLLGNVYSAKEESLEGLIQYLHAAHQAKDVAARDTFLQKALNNSKKIYLRNPRGDLDRLKTVDFASGSPAGIAARIFVARGYMYVGEPQEAESILKDVIESAEPTHVLRPKAEEILADLSKLGEVDSSVIGVLLPLSGKFGKFGRLCLNAITMAIGAFEEMPENPNAGNLKIVVRDSGDSVESALLAFETLVKEEKAIAVIGPLLSKQFPAIARRAQEFGTPLMSLSQRVEAGLAGSFVFPIALTPNQQIESVVNQAIKVNGFKRFAILAPSDSFGNEYVDLFWDEVERQGGQIVGIERYAPKSTDFREEIKKLLGLEYAEARSIEAEDLKKREEQYAATLKVKGKLRQRLLKAYQLKPIVTFDAIFIPDDPATIGQIAPAFAVQDVENIPMLGINTWNTSELVQRAGKYLQKSLFVDSFYPGSTKPGAMKFVQDYMKFFNGIPGTIEVQAFDAATILIESIRKGAPESRAQLRDQLLGSEKFTGITGEFQFRPEGVKRSAHLLSIRGNSIVEVPAP